MLPALTTPLIGQNFRTESEDMTGSVCATRAQTRDSVLPTPDRNSYFRYSHPSGPRRMGRVPHTDRSFRELIPWAAVSRSVVSPKARVERPAPSPFWSQVEAS